MEQYSASPDTNRRSKKMFDSAYRPVPVHKLEAVWCDNCEIWHVECKFGCCYLDHEQKLVFDTSTEE